MNKLLIGIIVVLVVLVVLILGLSKASAGSGSINMPAPAASVTAAPAAAPAAPAALPAGIVNGGVYRCATDGAIYKVQNGQKQHYANPTTYAAAGSPAFTTVDCNTLAQVPSGVDI